jgi:NADPH2:quinone reductase
VLVCGEIPAPVAGPGELVVAVGAADVLFLDTQLRAGMMADYFAVRPPYVPGGAVAGPVLAVGPEVSTDWVGRIVVGHTVGGITGGYAEQAVVSVATTVAVPDQVGVRDAAALAHDGATALALFDGAGIEPGEWVLVTGAAGGMGSLLVGLAVRAGARVIGAARGKRKLDLVRELGADVTVDYTEPGWLDAVRDATGAGVDVVFDGVGGELGAAAFTVTADGGRFSAHGAPAGGFAGVHPTRDITVTGIDRVQFTDERLRSLVERALAEGLVPTIGQMFPLARAADAHAAIEARDALGKTLIVPA